MSEPATDPYYSISLQLQDAIRFAEANQHLGLVLLLGHLSHSSDWRLSVVRTPEGIAGVSMILADGTWSLEAKSEVVALILAEIAGQARQARVLCTSELVRGWLQPRLASKGRILGEGQTVLLQAVPTALTGVGSWATQEAFSDLKAFWGEVRREDLSLQPPAWGSLIAFSEVAVAAGSAGIVAAVVCSGRTEPQAGLSLYRVPPYEGQRQVLRELVAFVAQPLVAEGKKVFARVDREDTQAVEFYSSLGFREVQAGYRATLRS
jgi:FR47-like protein